MCSIKETFLCEFSFYLVQNMTDQMSFLRDNEISIQYDFVCDVVESQDDGSNDLSMNSNLQNRVLR